MVCPTATVGQSYSVTFTLKEPGDACPTFKRELRRRSRRG